MKRFFRYRFFVQLFSFLGLNSYFLAFFKSEKLYTGPLKSFSFPVLNCYASPSAIFSCPAGSLQHFSIIKVFPFYITGIFVLSGAIVGRFFCGWACPFGFVQDLLKRLSKKRIVLPVIFTYGKYIFLIVLVVLIPLLTGEPWFCKLCPQGTLQAGIPQVLLRNELKTLIGRLYWVKIMILIFFVIGFVFIPRLFCRTICPVGGFLAIFNRISFLQIKVDSNKCNRCDKCREVCPVDISIYEDSSSPECVRCLACTFCPAVRAGSFIENAAIRTSPQ